jgi:hypothetical protein
MRGQSRDFPTSRRGLPHFGQADPGTLSEFSQQCPQSSHWKTAGIDGDCGVPTRRVRWLPHVGHTTGPAAHSTGSPTEQFPIHSVCSRNPSTPLLSDRCSESHVVAMVRFGTPDDRTVLARRRHMRSVAATPCAHPEQAQSHPSRFASPCGPRCSPHCEENPEQIVDLGLVA